MFQNSYIKILNAVQFFEYEKLLKLEIVEIPTIQFSRTNKNNLPTNFKLNKGHDLWCVEQDKIISNRISIYDSGIQLNSIQINHNKLLYHFEFLPFSNVLEKGYIVQPFIIDPNQSIKITVVKVDDSIPDPELPFCFGSLLMRKNEQYYMDFELNDFKNKQHFVERKKIITDMTQTKYKTGNDEIFTKKYI
jgi:hypothetical protein